MSTLAVPLHLAPFYLLVYSLQLSLCLSVYLCVCFFAVSRIVTFSLMMQFVAFFMGDKQQQTQQHFLVTSGAWWGNLQFSVTVHSTVVKLLKK